MVTHVFSLGDVEYDQQPLMNMEVDEQEETVSDKPSNGDGPGTPKVAQRGPKKSKRKSKKAKKSQKANDDPGCSEDHLHQDGLQSNDGPVIPMEDDGPGKLLFIQKPTWPTCTIHAPSWLNELVKRLMLPSSKLLIAVDALQVRVQSTQIYTRKSISLSLFLEYCTLTLWQNAFISQGPMYMQNHCISPSLRSAILLLCPVSHPRCLHNFAIQIIMPRASSSNW